MSTPELGGAMYCGRGRSGFIATAMDMAANRARIPLLILWARLVRCLVGVLRRRTFSEGGDSSHSRSVASVTVRTGRESMAFALCVSACGSAEGVSASSGVVPWGRRANPEGSRPVRVARGRPDESCSPSFEGSRPVCISWGLPGEACAPGSQKCVSASSEVASWGRRANPDGSWPVCIAQGLPGEACSPGSRG
jgi:hypothetical protein